MESKEEHTNKISRKKFLSVCGSLFAGGSIVGVSAVLLQKKVSKQRNTIPSPEVRTGVQPAFNSPYKLVSSFSLPDEIKSLEVFEDKLIAAVSGKIFVYDKKGSQLSSFAVRKEVRDISVENGLIYILYPTDIEVYDFEGQNRHQWDACSSESDYCFFTVTKDFVFVTDAANKNICKYTAEGNFVKFIDSPNGFIIPSYTFGITHIDGTIYCSNPGRHQIESYSLDGAYITAFGKPGGATGMFCGCCNPVHLSYTSNGEIITSEKGNPRISCYGRDGEFHSLLLDSKALGGGNTAYDVKVQKDKIFVAGKNLISTFQYDKTLAAITSCAKCKINCPLREGVLI